MNAGQTPIIVTSVQDLQRIVDTSVEAATTKVLSRIQPTTAAPKAWFTNKEAMDFLGLSKATLQRYRASGRLPYAKLGGNVYYRYTDLVAILETHLVGDQ